MLFLFFIGKILWFFLFSFIVMKISRCFLLLPQFFFFFSSLRSWLCLRTALVLLNLGFAFWTSCINITILLRVWGFSINIFSNKLLASFKILIPSRASVTPKIALLFGCEVSLDFVHLSSFHFNFSSPTLYSHLV